jgi:hypothetical protein
MVMSKVKNCLELAEALLGAAMAMCPHLTQADAPLAGYRGRLHAATARIFELLGGVFFELSMQREGGACVAVFFDPCEPLSAVYLRQYLDACQAIVQQHRTDLSRRFPYESMRVRAMTLYCLLCEQKGPYA